jgi:hypothetical protein
MKLWGDFILKEGDLFMKKSFKALLTASALALSLAMTPTVSVMASAQTGTSATLEGSATDNNPQGVLDENGQTRANVGEQTVDVQASILGSSEAIIYSIAIGYGDMQFTYDFGQTWDPVNHVYTNTETNASAGGWVTTNHVDGVNNAITITNNSNFPVSVNMTYEQVPSGSGTLFNTTLNQTGNVIGIFGTDNDALKQGVNTNAYKGYGSSTAGSMTTTSFDLDMDYSNLTFGEYTDYGVLKSGNAHYQKYFETIYFTLCGEPNSSSTLSTTYTSVGTIRITISPAAASKVEDRPAS